MISPRRFLPLIAVLTLVTALALTAGTSAAIPPGGAKPINPTGAKITLSKTVVKRGAVIKVTATRLPKRKRVFIKLDDSAIVLQGRTSRTGSFTKTYRVSTRTKLGRHWFRLLMGTYDDSPKVSIKSRTFTVKK